MLAITVGCGVLEQQTQRRLTPGPRGRPRKTPADKISPALTLKT